MSRIRSLDKAKLFPLKVTVVINFNALQSGDLKSEHLKSGPFGDGHSNGPVFKGAGTVVWQVERSNK